MSASDVGALLRLIVHDVRNPIATILANLEVLAMIEPDDPELPEILADLRSATQELDGGMEALSWIGRSLSGAMTIDPAPGDVVTSVRRAVQVPVDAPEGPIMARGGGSAGRLAAVLVASALRYGRSGHVRITTTDDMVQVAVSDSGTPVEPAHRDDLFDVQGALRLKQRSEARYARFLGLPALAAAVRDLGGSARVEEEADHRCLFSFDLPLA